VFLGDERNKYRLETTGWCYHSLPLRVQLPVCVLLSALSALFMFLRAEA
jgi:hypothetical protein